MHNRSQRGAITLEACVSVLLFLILMLFLSSFFVMFMAQNLTAHVALQTSQSLSMDVYTIERLIKEEGKIGSVEENLGNFITRMFGSSESNPSFVTDFRWYEGDTEQVEQVVQTRFLGYLSGGDETAADDLLKNMNVVNGINGLDFSESYVADNTLYIVLKYELEYDLNIWGLGTLAVEQKTCSKLWK